MEYTNIAPVPKPKICTSSRSEPYGLGSRCTSSRSRTAVCNISSRTFHCHISRTLMQRTHFHDTWRDSRTFLTFVVLVLLAVIQGTSAQGYYPSYSEYTSTFEWHNPDSLDPEGLNVCVRDR